MTIVLRILDLCSRSLLNGIADIIDDVFSVFCGFDRILKFLIEHRDPLTLSHGTRVDRAWTSVFYH